MSSKNSRRRVDLSSAINYLGFEIMPCSRCESKGLTCKMSKDLSRKCGECVAAGRPCDGSGVSLGLLNAIVKEMDRLDAADSAADDLADSRMQEIHAVQAEFQRRLKEAQDRLGEALARQRRIRRQKEFLRRKSAKMVREGLDSVEALERAEEQERQNRESAALLNSVDAVDWSGFMLPFFSEDAGGSDVAGPSVVPVASDGTVE